MNDWIVFVPVMGVGAEGLQTSCLCCFYSAHAVVCTRHEHKLQHKRSPDCIEIAEVIASKHRREKARVLMFLVSGLSQDTASYFDDALYGVAYRLLAANCHSRSDAWKIPDNKLIELGIVANMS